MTISISKDKWVTIHYTLKDDDGNILDSSVGSKPLGYLHGNGYLIAGLEKELEGKLPGDKFTAVIQPKDAYGEYNEALAMNVSPEQFEGNGPVEPGMKFQVMTNQGALVVTVTEVTDKYVRVDGNHELAGKTLHFDIEVVEVREPTEEELNPPSCGGCGGNCGGCGGDCGGDGGCGGCGDGGCGECGN